MMRYYCVFLFLLLVWEAGAFLEFQDFDDILWNSRLPKYGACKAYDSQGIYVSGTCKHKTQCLLSGGHDLGSGNCGILSTCCTHQGNCVKRTKSKISYFSSGTHAVQQDCTFVVELQNSNVCQVRLDFEAFQLADPSLFNRAIKCVDDYLSVTPNTYNIPTFCSNQAGQHVYVHVGTAKEVVLKVHTSSSSPTWNIRVTQLECPHTQSKFSYNHKQPSIVTDFPLLAPAGVIQYYTAPSGRFRSFGYDANYISGLNYAVAFRRSPDNSCVRLAPKFLNMRHTALAGGAAPAPPTCEDYLLFLLGLQTSYSEGKTLTIDPTESKQICPNDGEVDNLLITYNPPGPFVVQVFSKATVDDVSLPDPIYSFDLHYDITSC